MTNMELRKIHRPFDHLSINLAVLPEIKGYLMPAARYHLSYAADYPPLTLQNRKNGPKC